MDSKPKFRWEIAEDYQAVHQLLCVSDQFNSSLEAPAPKRNFSTTQYRVDNRSVHGLRCKDELIAMFTLSAEPAFNVDLSIFPTAEKPIYLSRLAVAPQWLLKEPYLGIQSIRKAIEIATTKGYDCIRSEANPDLKKIVEMLFILDFKQYGPILSGDVLRKIYLQKKIR